MVLFAIVKQIFAFKQWWGDKGSPQKVISQALIAGVLIQASRFLMAALVDLSTVATYAIWGLPLNVASSTDLAKHKILSVNSSLDLNKFDKDVKSQEYFKLSFSTKDPKESTKSIYFSECRVKDGYIMGRKDGDVKFKNDTIFGAGKNACVYGNQIVIFNELSPFIAPPLIDSFLYTNNIQNFQDFLVWQFDLQTLAACGYFIQVKGKVTATCNTTNINSFVNAYQNSVNIASIDNNDKQKMIDEFTHYADEIKKWAANPIWFDWWDKRLQNNPNAMALDSLVKKSKWWVGPLVTIYSSLLNFSQISNTTSEISFGEISGEMLIKIGFAIWLLFPLVALAIVLVVRIGFLWIMVVMSPFIVLAETFGFADKLGEHFKLGNIISVIFAPVVTVFALSISLVFMTAMVQSLQNQNKADAITKADRWQKIGITQLNTDNKPNTVTYSILWGCAELNFEGDGWTVAGTLDGFSRFLLNIFAIGLMRAVVFAAITTNSIGKKIWQQVQDFGASIFQTLPIIPVGWDGQKVGLGTAFSAASQYPEKAWIQPIENRQNQAMENFFNPRTWITSAQAEDIVKQVQALPSTATKVEVENIVNTVSGTNEIGTEQVQLLYTTIDKLWEGNKTEIAEKLTPVIKGPSFTNRKIETTLDDETKPSKAADKLNAASDADKILIRKWKDYKKSFDGVEHTLEEVDWKFVFTAQKK